jgi:RNase P subunit RPR2
MISHKSSTHGQTHADDSVQARPLRRYRGENKNPRGQAPRKPLPPSGQRVKYICEVCSQVKLTRRALTNHQRVKHEQRRDFLCDQCDQRFGYFECLVRHRRAKHENVIHTCHLCDFETTYRQTLTLHLRRVHLKLKPHVCELCDYRALSITRINKHRRAVHEKIKARERYIPKSTSISFIYVKNIYRYFPAYILYFVLKCCFNFIACSILSLVPGPYTPDLHQKQGRGLFSLW